MNCYLEFQTPTAFVIPKEQQNNFLFRSNIKRLRNLTPMDDCTS